MDLTIRQAGPDDADAISALVRGLLPYLVADPASPEVAGFVEALGPAATHERLVSPRFRYYLAEDEGALLGLAALRDGTHLYHLFVHADAHRRGVGRALWAHVQSLADGQTITVNASLFAVPAYERMGFRATDAEQSVDGLSFVPMVHDGARPA